MQGINFCGLMEESDREQNLEALRPLLTVVVHKWPDGEFVASQEVLGIMKGV